MDNSNNWIYFDKKPPLQITDLQQIANALTRIADELEKSNNYNGKHFANDIKDNTTKLYKENKKKIEEMRPYKDISPFDFGVLNGIDEACRIILNKKELLGGEKKC